MNFLVILADDLGWNDVGFHGGEIFTPNLDNLAFNGVRFNRFYAHPICTPTRSAVLTGRYPFRYGLQEIIWPWNNRGLPLSETLLPDVLNKNGYSTYAVGKWNLGHYSKKYYPTNRGFEKHYGNYTGSLDHFEHTYFGVHDFHKNGKPIYPKGHACDLCTSKACEWIERHDKKKPFFMYLAYNSPHLPLQPPEFYYNSYSKIKDEVRRKYCAMVTHLDASIGEIVNSLKKSGQYENTLVWFLSDNGGWTWNNCGGDNYPLKGGKVSCYEGGIRVVSFLHLNNQYAGEFNSFCHVTDLFPTILKLANIDSDDCKLDGMNISDGIFNKQDWSDRTIIHQLFYNDNNKSMRAAITKGNWKMIVGKDLELYDLQKDPYEKKNIAELYPNVCEELKRLLLSAVEKEYVLDPDDIWDSSNNGPPVDFKFPRYWGQRSNADIKMLKNDNEKRNFLELTEKEVYGYPKDWIPKLS